MYVAYIYIYVCVCACTHTHTRVHTLYTHWAHHVDSTCFTHGKLMKSHVHVYLPVFHMDS